MEIKYILSWILTGLGTILFFLTKNQLIFSIPLAIIIWSLVLYQSSQKKQDWFSEVLWTIGIGAVGGLIASLFTDAMKQQLTTGLVAGYLIAIICCAVLAYIGKVGKRSA